MRDDGGRWQEDMIGIMIVLWNSRNAVFSGHQRDGKRLAMVETCKLTSRYTLADKSDLAGIPTG